MTEKKRAFIINVLYFAIILALAIFACRYALFAVMPFFIAFLVSVILKPLIDFLRDKCHIHKTVASLAVVVLFYALIFFLVTIIGIKLFYMLRDFIARMPLIYSQDIEPAIYRLFDSAEQFAERLDPAAAAAYDVIAANVATTLSNAVASASRVALSGVTGITFKIPRFLLNILITLIATVFLSIDWAKIKEFVFRQLSDKTLDLVHNIRTHLSRTLGRYIRSYAVILFITFVEISIGLSIAKVPSALLIALIIAVFDILPVVGSGLVLMPWTLISLIQGEYRRALVLGIMYIIIIIVRNIVEPKIVGDRVGLHPIVTLMGMVVGVYLFGGIGLLGLPIALALIQSLNNEGVIHVFRKKPMSAKKEDGQGDAQPQQDAHPHGRAAERGEDRARARAEEADEQLHADDDIGS